MRTISEIINDCKSGKIPTIDEMRLTICCMDALSTFDSMAFRKLVEGQKEGKILVLTSSPEWQWKESFNRWKNALKTQPLKYLGENNNPDNPHVQKRRQTSLKLWDKILNKEIKKDT